MEKITMDRVIQDFNGIITDLDGIIASRNIDAAREALGQIEELVSNGSIVRDAEIVQEGKGQRAQYSVYGISGESGTYSEKLEILLQKMAVTIKRDNVTQGIREDFEKVKNDFEQRINEGQNEINSLEDNLTLIQEELKGLLSNARRTFGLNGLSDEQVISKLEQQYVNVFKDLEKSQGKVDNFKASKSKNVNEERRQAVRNANELNESKENLIVYISTALNVRAKAQSELDAKRAEVETLRSNLDSERRATEELINQRSVEILNGNTQDVDVANLGQQVNLITERLTKTRGIIQQLLNRKIKRNDMFGYFQKR